MKGERLTIVPGNADGFRATVSALRSLNGSRGASFLTFSLPEDRSARLLVKNLGRHMPESVGRKELGALGIRVGDLCSSDLGDAIRTQQKTDLRLRILWFRWQRAQKVPSPSEICGLRVSVETCGPHSPASMQALPTLRPHAA
jgi:hypothetical protein